MTGSELSFAKSVLVAEGNELAGPRQKAGQQVRKPWLRVRAVQFASEKKRTTQRGAQPREGVSPQSRGNGMAQVC